MAKFAVILPAAGASRRFRDDHYKKPFAPLANRAVWLHSAQHFLNRKDCPQVVVVIAPEDRDAFHQKFGANIAIMGVDVCEGGSTRADSVRAGLAHVGSDADFIAVHDAARPCLADIWIDRVFEAAEKTGAAILATPVADTLKRVGGDNQISATQPRDQLWAAQTPQVFRRQLLLDAYAQDGLDQVTDDAQLVEQLGHAVSVVMGSRLNLKITTKEDLRLAEQILRILPKPKADGFRHPFADDDLFR